MPLLPVNSPGQYLCKITDHGVDSGNDENISMQIECLITHEWNENQWQDISGQAYTIKGFVNLKSGTGAQYNPGAWNTKNLNTVAELFDWYDGIIKNLETMETTSKTAMITVENNKEGTYSRIKYLDLPKEVPGGNGVTKADPKKIDALSAKHSASIRGLIKKPATPRPDFVVPGQPVGQAVGNQAPWEGPAATEDKPPF